MARGRAPILLCIIGALSSWAFLRTVLGTETVWAWNEHCGPSALLVEVILDGRSLHHMVVPICPAPSSDRREALGARRISFSFTAPRPIAWHGYRDREDVAAADASLTIELWEASADANGLMLGIAVSDPVTGAIYMQSVHLAKANKESATDIAPGVILRSRPYRLSSR